MAVPAPKRETILLADDESAIRRMLSSILESSGFHVLQAKNGKEGLNAAAIHEGPIHLLIADMQMPGLDGPELAVRLQAVRPGVRVILMSGHDESRVPLIDGWTFLNKPFSPTEFINTVNKVLSPAAPLIPSQPAQFSNVM
jgi:two-component system cell cycle sensor histidine kinase/response regulator CckA